VHLGKNSIGQELFRGTAGFRQAGRVSPRAAISRMARRRFSMQ